MYHHHSECKRLGITHLSFAGDILLFSRGDYQSVELIFTAFQSFSDSTGLNVKPQKCHIFCSGIDEDIISRVKHLSGFTIGSLPVRYLGVPLNYKKLSIAHYLPLIERITGKIRALDNKITQYSWSHSACQNCVYYSFSVLDEFLSHFQRCNSQDRIYM